MTRPFTHALLVGLALSLLGPALPAQEVPPNESDPRSTKDPRDVSDPRSEIDPREVEPDPLLGPPGPELYDALYQTGQETRLKQSFVENAWSLLAYLESHCRAWLSMKAGAGAATPAGREQLAALETKGRALARMADEALLDTRYQRYVDAVFHWTDEQQAQAREGRELFTKGLALASAARDPIEALAALAPLQESLDRARRLGDTSAQSAALTAIGNLQAASRDEQAACDTMREALRIGREVRDLDSVWTALSVLYESGVRTSNLDQAQEALQEQYLIAQDVDDPQTLQRVLQQLVKLDEYRESQR